MTSNEKYAHLSQFLHGRSFADCQAQYDRDGYLIIENVLDAEQVQALRNALQPFLDQDIQGRNEFEGVRTNRVYALLAKSPVFADLAIHPLALAFAEADVGESCLLASCLAINLLPGESVQPWHTDDAHIDIARPHPPYGVSTFWALDDTTEENGATELLPGSHCWDDSEIEGSLSMEDFAKYDAPNVEVDPGWRADAVKATMPAGSFMVAKGTLWHRGGANKSNQPRLIITPQYCPGWARSLENMMAAVPRDIAATLPQRARELIGYSIHPPFMGYVNGVHPQKQLDSGK